MDIQSEIITKLAGATSDHLPIYIRVEFAPAPKGTFDFNEKLPLSLCGASHNQMYQCTSLEDHQARDPAAKQHYANNPFNYSESKEEWRARKLVQLRNEIIVDIKGKNLDFYFLQECDWIFDKALRAQYTAELGELGWSFIQTEKEDNCQPLVTLFKTAALEFNKGSKSILFKNHKGVGRAFECVFTQKHTGCRVALANLHLMFGQFYNDEILKYQYALIRKDIYGVAGGDVNNEQNVSFIGATGNYLTTTNISNKPGDIRSIEATRRDVFFVSPTSNTAARAIIQLPSRIFSMHDQTIDDKQIELLEFDPSKQVLILQDGKKVIPVIPAGDQKPYCVNKSFIGHPYMRRQGILAMHYMLAMHESLTACGGNAFVNKISACLEMAKIIDVLQLEPQSPAIVELLEAAQDYGQINIHDDMAVQRLIEELKQQKYTPPRSKCILM